MTISSSQHAGSRRFALIVLLVIAQGSLWPVYAKQPHARPPVSSSATPLTADEVAMLLGTLVVADARCAIKSQESDGPPLGQVVARLGYRLEDYAPDGRYASLLRKKIEKANEFIAVQGKEAACEGMHDVLRKFLPMFYP